jgi:hypothetical protein
MSILTWQYASLRDLVIWWCCDSYQKLLSPTMLQLRYLQHRVGWQMSFIGIRNCLQLWAAHTASSGLDRFFDAYHMHMVYGTNPCAFWHWVFCCLSMKNALELLNHGMQMSWLGLNVSLSCIRIVFMRRSNRNCLLLNWTWQFTCCAWSSGIRGACFGVANQILVSSPFVFWKPICSSIPNDPWEKSCPFESWLQ